MGLVVVNPRQANLLCDRCTAIFLADGTHKSFYESTDADLIEAPLPIGTIGAAATERGWRQDTRASTKWWCPDCVKAGHEKR